MECERFFLHFRNAIDYQDVAKSMLLRRNRIIENKLFCDRTCGTFDQKTIEAVGGHQIKVRSPYLQQLIVLMNVSLSPSQ